MSITALPAKPAPSPLVRFDELRLQAAALLLEASRLPGLAVVHTLQAEASAGIAGIKLHRIHGQGDSDDALALRADLEVIACKVDPLIAEYGRIAASEFHRVDQKQFEDVLANAIADGAAPELSAASERAAEDRVEADNDTRRPGTHRARMAREA